MTSNIKKKQILHDLGLRYAKEQNIGRYDPKCDLKRIASEYQASLIEEAKKQNNNAQEVPVINE